MSLSLWVDKYRPTSLNGLDFHPEITDQLRKLTASGDFPHMVVYGPPGSAWHTGKKTRIAAVLRELYGVHVERLKIDHKVFETPSGKKLDLNVLSSNYHLEMNPSDVGMHDRVVVPSVIKEIAQTQQLDPNAPRSFKVVVIHEGGSLSRDAQAGLRRTMEKYTATLRIIICCNATSNLIAPIRSRCMMVRVPAPTEAEIGVVLGKVAKKEGMQLPDELARRIAVASERNVRRAVLMLETCRVQQYPFSDTQPIELPDWQRYVRDLASNIITEQSPRRLQEVRMQLYELLVHCIPPTVVLKTLTFELIKNLDGQLKSSVVQEAAFYEHRLQLGSKPIFHLEAFVAKFMSLYKQFLIELTG